MELEFIFKGHYSPKKIFEFLFFLCFILKIMIIKDKDK
jgi:hypothetical protein